MYTLNDLPNSVFAPETDTQPIKRLETMLEKAYPKLVGDDGEEILLPDSIYQALCQIIHMMAAGQVISLVPYNLHLSSQQASDLLNVSRPHLYKLLDRGDIPYIKVGTHRRIQFQNLMKYKQQRDSDRRQALSELTELSQELGFYTPETNRLKDDISQA